ncbi:serine hydrolase domain-containing protein [Mesoterricola silvestris]|uniref:Esterase n=1 Tax=Mesoterricola silvestris TaxID=2927979 RepID=A0AA48GQM3_9BACT|nr:serine hydrolase domain-containing protein [Mesoterricola silvestris]BDU72420.1 esterase [Mesoterricola silvestris]
MFYDLASLAKPLVTAPLAHRHLDLDEDRRGELGFLDRPEPLTVRQLLSHSAGLPPWLPFTGEPLAAQLARGFPAGAHPKLVRGTPGTSLYSDLGYRLLAELLERRTGVPFAELGAASSGLEPAPWREAPAYAPQGPDLDMWKLAEPALPFPPRDPHLPNDANARAGMRGHAGFGTDAAGLRASLERWVASGAPLLMARDAARGADGSRWGLGLQRAFTGPGRFGELLEGVRREGVHVVEWDRDRLSPAVPDSGPGPASAFWYHLGFTGPALFFRPEDGLCVAVLAHRVGPGGGLLDAAQLQARRMEALSAWL